MTGAVIGADPAPSALAALVLVALFLASFFFAGTETALFSLQRVDHKWLARGGATGQQVVRMLRRPPATVATILVGNASANVAIATTTAAWLAGQTPHWTWLNVVVLTPLLVLTSEITPKVLASRFNRTWSRAAVWPLTAFHHAVAPLRWVFTALVGVLARVFGATAVRGSLGLEEEELRLLIDHGAAAGELDPEERDIIESVLEFDELTVERLMTPRPDMFSLSMHMAWDDLVRACVESGYSRIPIYAGRTDDIVGVLLLKDLLKHRRNPPDGPGQLRANLVACPFLPASKSAADTMREFLERRIHMAFVVDEHGTLVGLVTLHDLLGELLGELEADTDESGIAEIGPQTFTVRGSADIEDFAEETGIVLPLGDYHTVGGFVFHELGRLPRRGDRIVCDDHLFRVKSMDGRRIDEVTVIRPATPATEPGS